MGGQERIPLVKAVTYAERFSKVIRPYVEKFEIAGSVRRLCETVGDIEIVCIENPLNSLDNIFIKGKYPGLVMNGKRLKRFKFPKQNLQIELYITSPHDYGRILAIRTGSSAFSHHLLAVTWNRMGFCGVPGVGLRKKKECDHKGSKWVLKPEFQGKEWKPPPFYTEYDFFDFLNLKWVPPEQRNWKSRDDSYNYSL